jgi:hypothetical protein
MYLYLYMGLDDIILMWATSILRATGRGRPWKLRLFWALKWPPVKRVPFGPKKVEIFRAHPFQ